METRITNRPLGINLIVNKCLCGQNHDQLLYAEKIDWDNLTHYEFSARRNRKIQHYRLVRCLHCALVRSDPILCEDTLTAFYQASKFLCEDESKLAAQTYYDLFDVFASSKTDRILEIGCGNGSFLKKLWRHNYKNITGLDPGLDAGRQADLEIKPLIKNKIFKKNLFKENTFDLVCAFHVLDHVSNPATFLKEISNIIKTKGLVLIICHDVDALINKIFGEYSPVFDIEHIFLFNQNTLHDLLENNGFNVIKMAELKNTYHLNYWLKYIPIIHKLTQYLPGFLVKMKLSLKAGNLFIIGKKRD